jgi:predicted amidohydrolase
MELQRRRKQQICSCFSTYSAHGDAMSLNRCEQRVFDYLQSHQEERQHWQEKFQATVRVAGNEHVAVNRLAEDLWRYYEERSAVASPFKEAAVLEGVRRISMKNLAELLLRLWTEPRAKPSPTNQRNRLGCQAA